MSLILAAVLVAGLYVGWNIGANDTANCIGTTLGCGLITFRNGVILVAIFAVLGSVLEGRAVMETVGTGIVKGSLSKGAIVVALISSGFFVTLATFFKLPVSTAQSIVGGIVGIGLAVNEQIDFSRFITIAESWIICPILAMVLSFVLYHGVNFILGTLKFNPILTKNTLGWLTILSSCYVAYSLGANNTGVAVGPIANLGIIPPGILLFMGGCGIAVGAFTYGKKVAYTVGRDITSLDIPGAFAAQISSAAGIHLFTILGIPVSTSSAIVGAVVGTGLVRGSKSISIKTLIMIFTGWVLTPCLAALASFAVYRGLNAFF